MQQSVTRRARGRRRLVAAGVAALLLAAVAPAAADAEGWIPGPAFDVRYEAPGAAVAATPGGASFAAWIQDGRGGARVAFQRATADGTLGAVHTLPNAMAGVRPVVAADAGGAAVVWRQAQVGPPVESLQLTLLAPDGTPRVTGEIDASTSPGGSPPAVVVAPDGDTLAVWIGTDNADSVVRARRVAADGTAGPSLQLGRSNGGLDAALAPDGTGWITWTDDLGAQQVARIGTDGDVDGGVEALPVDMAITSPALDASADGAIFTGLDLERVRGVRLESEGPVVGSTFESSTEAVDVFGASAVLADDGTVALAWTEAGADPADPAFTARYSRVAPNASSGPAEAIAPEATGWGTAFPRLALAGDGSLLAAWTAGGAESGGPLVARRIAADGSRGIALRTGLRVSRPSGTLVPAERIVPLASTPDGGGFAATIDVEAADASAIETVVLDVTPPDVTATIPEAGLTGEAIAFSATATDRAGVAYWWDFGDGSGARAASTTHTYALPGSYAVTVTVTDGAGNVTTVGRTLAIAPPPTPVCDCLPLPIPPVRRPPVEQPPAPRPPVTRAHAALRLTSAVRSGSTVTVAGTISATATGRVSLLYAQKQGRRTLTARANARIAAGRFRATIRLTRALAKGFRLKPTVTASYPGDTATASGEAARTVTARAARRGARARRGRRAARR